MPVVLSFPDNVCLELLYSPQNSAKWPYKIERTSETCSLIALLYLSSLTHARTHIGWVIEFVEVPINTPGVWLPWLHGPSLESHNVRQLYLSKVQKNRRVLREQNVIRKILFQIQSCIPKEMHFILNGNFHIFILNWNVATFHESLEEH